jgi:hypothetical protein
MGTKRLIFAVLLVAVSLITVSFKPLQKPNDDGQVRWHKATQDLGAVLFNKTVDMEFKFTNVSKHPVVITRVVPSCGCTVPKYDERPILPGQEGVIRATFKGDSRGAFNKKITVLMDVGTYELFLRGQVVD